MRNHSMKLDECAVDCEHGKISDNDRLTAVLLCFSLTQLFLLLTHSFVFTILSGVNYILLAVKKVS